MRLAVAAPRASGTSPAGRTTPRYPGPAKARARSGKCSAPRPDRHHKACGLGPCAGGGPSSRSGQKAGTLARRFHRPASTGPGTFCTANPPFQLCSRFAPSPALHFSREVGDGLAAEQGIGAKGPSRDLCISQESSRRFEGLALPPGRPSQAASGAAPLRGPSSLGLQALEPCLRSSCEAAPVLSEG